jgi:hypothetical protein
VGKGGGREEKRVGERKREGWSGSEKRKKGEEREREGEEKLKVFLTAFIFCS